MDYPNADELEAQRRLLNKIGSLSSLAVCMDALFELAAETIAEHPKAGAATKVGHVLVARLTNDFRVCSIASSLGYGLQALNLAASMMEILGALAYVGDDEVRAAEWARHTKRRKSYPEDLKAGREATLDALGISDPAARADWHTAYEFMCMAKHANPLLSLQQGLSAQPDGLAFVFGPDTTALGVFLSAEAFNRAIGYGTAAVFVYALLCSDKDSQILLRNEAAKIRDAAKSLHPLLRQLQASAKTAL